jgi:hypothetical protein
MPYHKKLLSKGRPKTPRLHDIPSKITAIYVMWDIDAGTMREVSKDMKLLDTEITHQIELSELIRTMSK